MSAQQGEESMEVNNEESSVCVGDGTTCVECGKVFTHTFYFSTHISTHVCQKGFDVVGQCAFCGLVFSDGTIFAAHMTSSKSRLEELVMPEDEIHTTFTDPEVSSQSTPESENFGTLQDNTYMLDPETMNSAHGSDIFTNGCKSSMTDQQRPKRKRKAPDRYDPDQVPQLTPSKMDSDPEVEAYLRSLQQMGLTVDSAVFSNHRDRRRHQKVSAGNHGRSKGIKEGALIECIGDSSPDAVSLKKESPKFEYLDSDDSPDDDVEVLPKSGKLTRGQRLQQRKERQEQSNAEDIKIPSHNNCNSGLAEYTKYIPATGVALRNKISNTELPLINVDVTTKCGLSTSGSGDVAVQITGHHRTSISSNPDKKKMCKSLLVSNSENINTFRTIAMSSVSKFSTVTSQFISQANQVNSFETPPASQIGSKRTQDISSLTQSASDRTHMNSTRAGLNGHRTLGYQESQMRDRKVNLMRTTSNMDVQKPDNLEDLKKDSRENVQEMLQSVGMTAVASSLAQGKMFSLPKSDGCEISQPSNRNRRVGMFGDFSQASYSHDGFKNRPKCAKETKMILQPQYHQSQTKSWSTPVGNQVQTTSPNTWTNNLRSPQAPQNLKNNPHVPESCPQGLGHNRGLSGLKGRGQHICNDVRRIVPNDQVRGWGNPITNSVHPAGIHRNTTVNRQIKLQHSSDEVIVIDDDDDDSDEDIKIVGVDEISNADPVLNRMRSNIQVNNMPLGADKSNNKGEDDHDDLICIISDVKTVVDRTPGSPVLPFAMVEGISTCEKSPSHEEETLDHIISGTEVDSFSPQSGGCSEHSRNSNVPFTAKSSLQGEDNEKSDGEDDSKSNIADMPGEDIFGWKVCLAENSDSDDDDSANSDKISHDGDHLSQSGSPQPGHYSSPHAESSENSSRLTDSACHQNSQDLQLDHSSSSQSKTSKESQKHGSSSPQESQKHGSSSPQESKKHGSSSPQESQKHGSSSQQESQKHGSSSPQESQKHGSSSPQESQKHGSSSPQESKKHGSSSPQESQKHGSSSPQESQKHGSSSPQESQKHGSSSPQESQKHGSSSPQESQKHGSSSPQESQKHGSSSPQESQKHGSSSPQQNILASPGQAHAVSPSGVLNSEHDCVISPSGALSVISPSDVLSSREDCVISPSGVLNSREDCTVSPTEVLSSEQDCALALNNALNSEQCGVLSSEQNCTLALNNALNSEQDCALSLGMVLNKKESQTLDYSKHVKSEQDCSELVKYNPLSGSFQIPYSERQKECNPKAEVDQHVMVSNHSYQLNECSSSCGLVDMRPESLIFNNVTSIHQDSSAISIDRLSEAGNPALLLPHLEAELIDIDCAFNIREKRHPMLEATAGITIKSSPLDKTVEGGMEQNFQCSKNSSQFCTPNKPVTSYVEASRKCLDFELSKEECTTDNGITEKHKETSVLTSSFDGKLMVETESSLSSSYCNSDILSDKRMTFSSVSESELSFDKKETDSRLEVVSGKSYSRMFVINSSSPAPFSSSSSSVFCNDGHATYNSAESLCDSSSHSVTSQTSAISANFVSGDNSLLDIFTEIEKTCKEMEETLERQEGIHKIEAERVADVERTLSNGEESCK